MLQLLEGFEHGSNAVIPNPSGGSSIVGDDRAVSLTGGTAGPWSRYCYTPGVSVEYLPFRDQSGTHFYVMARLYLTSFAHDLIGIIGPSGTGTRHGGIAVSGTGQIQLKNSAGTVVGTSTELVYANAWNLLEFELTVADSASGNVWLHGVSTADIAVTTQDFKAGSDTTGAGLYIWGNSGFYIDDVIVYDSQGSSNNARVGDMVVPGLLMSAKGDQEQWDPKKTGSVSRFYFPKARRFHESGGTKKDGFPAPVGVAPDASWEYTNPVETDDVPAGRLTPETTGYATPSTAATNDNTDSRPAYDVSGSAPWDLLGLQYVSPALAATTISGTAKLYMLVAEETAADNIASQLVIRVVSNDGQTVRGTLYSGDTDATNPPSSEWSTTATARGFPRFALLPITLSSLAISEGDRLVVELGARMRGVARTSVGMTYITGANGTVDVSENETDTTQAHNAWLDLSSALTLSDDGNWDHLAETPPDDDGTYVSTSTDNDLDLYNVENVDSALATQGPLCIFIRARKVDPGSRTLTVAYKTSGATQTGSAHGVPTSYAYVKEYLDVDATDSGAWSDSKVNALQVGIKATT